jgi:hypothetical protein
LSITSRGPTSGSHQADWNVRSQIHFVAINALDESALSTSRQKSVFVLVMK